LRRHASKAHGPAPSERAESQLHQCDECGQVFSAYNLKRHKKWHVKDLSCVCTTCGKQLSNLAKLRIHERLHAPERLFKCQEPDCDYGSCERWRLKNHVQQVHLGIKVNVACPVCDKQVQKKALYNHVQTHMRRPRPHQCGVCGRTFVAPLFLKQHMDRHQNERRFHCDRCDKCFNTRASMITHWNNHLGTNAVWCGVCKKKFSSAACLKRHMVTHSGLKPHVCQVCGRAFAQRSPLVTHIKVLHPEVVLTKRLCS
jgi:KRAB domain-containing zinc finger protein